VQIEIELLKSNADHSGEIRALCGFVIPPMLEIGCIDLKHAVAIWWSQENKSFVFARSGAPQSV
jgi:hypothetical protein